MFGSIVIFAFFPVLAYDMDQQKFRLLFASHCTSISAAGNGCIPAACIASNLFNGEVIARDLLHAPIAGGIMVGSAASFIANPVLHF